jgi:hypothetical protein
MNWITENFKEFVNIVFLGMVVAILAWSFITGDINTIEKILLVALALFSADKVIGK